MSIFFCEEIGTKREEAGGKSVAVLNPARCKCSRIKIKPVVSTVEKSVSSPKKNLFLKYLNMVEKFLNPVFGVVSLMIFAVSVLKHGIIDGLMVCLGVIYLLSMVYSVFIGPLITEINRRR